jgi:hypothetical protein
MKWQKEVFKREQNSDIIVFTLFASESYLTNSGNSILYDCTIWGGGLF